MVKLLLKSGNVRANIINDDFPAIIQSNSFEYGDTNRDLIKLLLEYGADINTDNGIALVSAVEGDEVNLVQFLLENDAEVDENNSNVLYIAVQSGFMDVAKLLIEYGADPNTLDQSLLSDEARLLIKIVKEKITSDHSLLVKETRELIRKLGDTLVPTA